MLQSHFSCSVWDIIIQHDFWTASCTIRNSAALGKKTWFRLLLYYMTVYIRSPLPSHSLFEIFVCMCLDAWMHSNVGCIRQLEFIYPIPSSVQSKRLQIVYSVSNVNTLNLVMAFCCNRTARNRQQSVMLQMKTFDVFISGQRSSKGVHSDKPHRPPQSCDLQSD